MLTDVIAKHLANLECEVKEIKNCQQEILKSLNTSTLCTSIELPRDIKLPCQCISDLDELETWIRDNDDNQKTLVSIVFFYVTVHYYD